VVRHLLGRGAWVVLVASLLAGRVTIAAADDPAEAVRGFLLALASGDARGFERWSVADPDGRELLPSVPPSKADVDRAREDLENNQPRQTTPCVVDGEPLNEESPDKCPVGARTAYFSSFRGSAVAVPVVRTPAGWRVDVRFFVAGKRMAEGRAADASAPETQARGFLFHVLAKKPDALKDFATSPIDGRAFTAANDLPGGDLDQVLSLCMEMPIVRARAGERLKLPDGQLVEGGGAETLALIGLMGPVEIPFKLVRQNGAWKVVPQRYFEMLRMRGAI
jgi:hypothetical protein